MKEPSVRLQQPIVANGQASEVPQPANRALDDPAAPGAAALPTLLMGGLPVVGSSRADRVDPPPHQPGAHGVATVAPVRDQPRGLPDDDGVARRFQESDLRRGDAASRDAPNGVPAPSATTIHVVPLPRLVGPTLGPPFSPGRSCHQGSTRSSESSARHSTGPEGPARAPAARPWFPAPSVAANTCWGCHTSWAARSKGRPSIGSRESPPTSAEPRRAVARLSGGVSRQGDGERICSHWASVRWRHAMCLPFAAGGHGADSTSSTRF